MVNGIIKGFLVDVDRPAICGFNHAVNILRRDRNPDWQRVSKLLKCL